MSNSPDMISLRIPSAATFLETTYDDNRRILERDLVSTSQALYFS
jgi:hypothetical protein